MNLMKKLFFISFFALANASVLFSQIVLTKSDVQSETSSFDMSHRSYQFTGKCFIYPFREDSSIIDRQRPLTPPLGAKFYLVSDTGDYVVIMFWNWPTSSVNYNTFNKSINGSKQLYFAVKKSDMALVAQKWFARSVSAEFGILSIPFKLRFAPFDYSKDISFNATAAAKWRIGRTKENYISLMGGVGITSVTLDSASTFREEAGDTLYVTGSRSAAAFSFVGGLVFEFNKIQIGVFTGFDALGGNEARMWRYQYSPFFAVGIGFSLFTISTSNEKSAKGNN